MLLMRLAGMLTVIAIAAGILAYLFTRESRYLRLSWRIAKWALIFCAVVLSLMALERIALI